MLKRRDFLKLCAGAALAGPASELDNAESRLASKCRPVISGTLWWCSPEQSRNWGATGWIKELQEQLELGFDLLWLVQGPRLIGNEFSLRQLLDVCAHRQIQVIVDTGSTSNWYAPLDLKRELELCRRNIGAVGEELAGHPAFFGWYIPHEIYMDWGVMHDYVSHLYPALVEACKRAAALPVTLSPFFILDRTKVFGDFRFNEPDEYEEDRGKLIRKSGLDIVMMQDSGEHFSYVQDAQRRPLFRGHVKSLPSQRGEILGQRGSCGDGVPQHRGVRAALRSRASLCGQGNSMASSADGPAPKQARPGGRIRGANRFLGLPGVLPSWLGPDSFEVV